MAYSSALAPALLSITLAAASCAERSSATSAPERGGAYAKTVSAVVERPDGWDEYWYTGLAEVNTYDLEQVRYGEPRSGEAVLVFVTEPFLPEAQVKDDGLPSDEEAVSVMKLNRIHRFTTGIYDYSLMLSAFTPVSRDRYPHTLKTSLSTQDWCGHSWFQLNLEEADGSTAAYEASRRSYFQAEGDVDVNLEGVILLEDELPALVRLDPTLVPTGELQVVPGAMFSALQHLMPEPQLATTSVDATAGALVVSIGYPDLERTLTYTFAPAFPHQLQGWEETLAGQPLSSGQLRASRRSAYWGENGTMFVPLRDSLGL